MTRRLRLILLPTLAATLTTTFLPAVAAETADRPDPAAVARQRLAADGSGHVVVDRDASGDVRFVGTGAHASLDNPDVVRGMSVAAAARAHLDRYGAALGAAEGTTFVREATTHTSSGVDSVRYTQLVSGVPVIGGDVVVGVGPDRELRSMQSVVSTDAVPSAATISEAAAAATARGVVTRATRSTDLDISAQGRGVLDPNVVDVSLPSGPRTVWRFEVGDGAAVRQLVLVDDHTGHVLLRANQIEHADRVVCDKANVRSSDTPCTTGFARTEASGASVVADVNTAFDLSGVVSDFYQQVAGLDLTQLLGVDVSGVKKLASTVRFCPPTVADGACPYDNAFWNGQQMFYGDGWAGADDVVGHEMTHGVIDQFSKLFYWGQSGAINESMADIIGELIDHGRGSDDDSAWTLGEDSPMGTIRSMSNPPLYGQPDTTTSNLYDADASYSDAGGVHTNSGVGNKTAYLISSIDGSDPSLPKTAALYVDVIQRLTSGADWAALAAQLDQSCQDLRGLGTAGFTSSDCDVVHQAGVDTGLRTPPTNAAPPGESPTTCPAGTTRRVLLDSEAAPSSFTAGGWSRESAAGSSNATTGGVSWFAADPGTSTISSAWIQSNPLQPTSFVALPAGQKSFLSFENWYLFDYDSFGYYDGGTVELGVQPGAPALGSTDGGTWTNGPNRTLETGYGNSGGGHPAFSGDSHGWSVSTLDLTAYAGHSVLPQFTMRSDNQYGFIGWYLDDIRVYTCDPPPGVPASVNGVGGVAQARISWTAPTLGAASVTGYRLRASNGKVVVVGRSARSALMTGLGSGAVSVEVRALGSNGYQSGARTVVLAGTTTSLALRRSGRVVKLSGVLRRGGRGWVGRRVVLERRSGTSWIRIAAVTTSSGGKFVTTYTRRKAAVYRARYAGGVRVMGSVSPQRRK